MTKTFNRPLRRLYRLLQKPIKIRIFCKKYRFHLITPTEERIKRYCLDRLIDIWDDRQSNKSQTSSIALAIEGSEVLLPYLEFKYPKSEDISWRQYFEECTNIRLFLLNELIKKGHGQYINDTNRFGNTPLIFACALKEPRLVRFLLDHGAVITQPFRCKYCSNGPIGDHSEARLDRTDNDGDLDRDSVNQSINNDDNEINDEDNESSLLLPSSNLDLIPHSSRDQDSNDPNGNSSTNSKSDSTSKSTNSSLFCRHHLTEPKERFDMLGHCGKMKQEYSRLSLITAGRVPASFFASKAHVIEEILDMINDELTIRRERLEQCLNETKWIPEALAPIIVDFVPL